MVPYIHTNHVITTITTWQHSTYKLWQSVTYSATSQLWFTRQITTLRRSVFSLPELPSLRKLLVKHRASIILSYSQNHILFLTIGLYHYYLTMSTFCNKFLINYSYFFWDKGKNIKKQWFCNVKYGWYFHLIHRSDWTELIWIFGDRGEAEKSTSEEVLFMEAPPRFELGNRSFADSCLTTWLWRRI